MAESMKGLKRTHRCAELSAANVGEKVTIMGWVQKNRNKGGLVFVDVRDRSGIIQVVFEEGKSEAALIEKAAKLRAEYVVAIVGTVAKRSGAVNDHLATGEIEVLPEELRILSESETPPFHIEENSKTKEEVRLKYRYLDLRRPDLQRNLMMRSKVATLTRQFLAEEGFLEIETPVLIKSTPEGARDYLVPARNHPGKFYALPQAPQQFKQLLMTSGFDRYFQIAPCFRDEVLPPHAQAALTQAIRPALFRQEAPGPVQQGTSADSHHTSALLGQVCLAFFPSLLLTIPFYDNILRWICQAFSRELFYSLASTTPVRSTGVPSRHRRSSP